MFNERTIRAKAGRHAFASMRALLLVVLLGLAAGCAAPAVPAPDAPGVEDAIAAGWTILPLGLTGGEPSVGVTSSGAIFLAGVLPGSDLEAAQEDQNLGGKLARSTDGGRTWELVGDVARDPKVNHDPWAWVDPDTDRVFNVPLNALACPWLAWTDDEGATWGANPAVACAPPSHDHQKLVTGPPAAGVVTRGYPNVVYYAYNSLLVTGTAGLLGLPPLADERLGTIVAVSLDGGLTFSEGRIIHASGCHRGIIGPPAVAPDGRVYVPHGTCDGLDVMISADSGSTWTTTSLDAVGSLDDFAFDPGVAVDPSGAATLVWPGRDALLYVATSRDGGVTWSAPQRITPPEVTATVYSSIVAVGEGRVGVAYAATTRDPSGWAQRASSFADDETVWHLHVALIEDGRFATQRITSEDDPLQRGCIWMRGGESDCRNLLDFVTMTQRDGALYLAYTDGCDLCASASESRGSQLMLAVAPQPAWPAAP
jgi:hypothetical protein